MMSILISMFIGFMLALFVGTCYVKFKRTDNSIQTGQCKWCKGQKTILRGFTPFMIEHYCPECKQTFFTER